MKSFKPGTILMMDFSPTKGHEQQGRRPAVVVNNLSYGLLMELAVVCPITNTKYAFPTHVCLDSRTKTTGNILCEHLRTVDLSKRNARVIEGLPKDLFTEVQDIIASFFE